MFRTILSAFSVLIFFILTAPILLLNKFLNLLGKNMDILMLKFLQFILSLIKILACAKPVYLDFHKIPKDKAVLFIMNHQSIFDIILSYPKWKRRTGYIAKKELAKPFFKGWMSAGKSLFVDRSDIKSGMKTIIEAIKNIKSGISMVIFPESTINKTGNVKLLQEFKNGSFKIAQKADCLIVPIVIAGTNDIFEAQKPKIKSRTKCIFKCLNPINIKDLSDENQKNIGEYFRNLMQVELTKIYNDNF